MPTGIILILTAAPVLALSMLSGTSWSPEVLEAARLALAASMLILVMWVVVDAIQSAKDWWRRFLSRPY